jgi:branched-chain amino acid transport system substrate-binding protein
MGSGMPAGWPRASRRTFLKSAGAVGAVAATSAIGGCERAVPAPSGRAIRIGFVSAQTGPLGAFGEADNFILADVRRQLAGGLRIGSKTHPVEILVMDNQSDAGRARTVAFDLMAGPRIDIVLTHGAPETINPVADVCEQAEVPCVSSSAPWQPWLYGRRGDLKRGFRWTYHFFWGMEDVIRVFGDLWQQVQTNKVVGPLFAQNVDGDTWASKEIGLPGVLSQAGYRFVSTPRPPDSASDFTQQIDRFLDAKAEILTGNPASPDFATFWKQAGDRGYRPRIATVGKALLFPAFVEAMSPAADGLSSEVWWSPSFPYRSSLTGASAAQLAAEYTRQTGKQWTQPLGFDHALFEVAVDALRRARDLDDRTAVVEAISDTRLATIVGPLDWTRGKVPNVAKTPLVGGQWRAGSTFPYDLVIVTNTGHPEIPVAGKLRPLDR